MAGNGLLLFAMFSLIMMPFILALNSFVGKLIFYEAVMSTICVTATLFECLTYYLVGDHGPRPLRT